MVVTFILRGAVGRVRDLSERVDVKLAGDKEGVISGRRYSGVLPLAPYEVDLLQ